MEALLSMQQKKRSITINAAKKRSIDQVDTDEEDEDEDDDDDLYLPAVRRRSASPAIIVEQIKPKKYILEMREFDDISFVDGDIVYSMDNNLCLDERLALSSINYVHNCLDDDLLAPCDFPEAFYIELKMSYLRVVLIHNKS